MGPVSLVAGYQHMLGFAPGWLGRETGYRPTDRSIDVLWIVSGALFLGSSGAAQIC
jgi:hypothetical protein